jgi:hypothetical protein
MPPDLTNISSAVLNTCEGIDAQNPLTDKSKCVIGCAPGFKLSGVL